MSRIRWFSLVAAATLTACAPLPSGFGNDQRAQTLTSGSHFGVTIGMDRDTARKTLITQEFAPTLSADCEAGKPDCEEADRVDNYRAEGVSQVGSLEIYSRDGVVIRLRWWALPREIS